MSTPADPPLSRRAARLAEQSPQPESFARPDQQGGLGSTPISVPSSAPTDVSYRTQVRPRVPHYDTPPKADQPHTSGPIVPSASVPPAPLAPPASDRPMRRRDFRPPAVDPAPSVPPAGPPTPSGFDTALDYHTQLVARPDAPAPVPPQIPVGPAHVIDPPAPTHAPASSLVSAPAPAPAPAHVPVEQTLSRRELRALREQLGHDTAEVTVDALPPGGASFSGPPPVAPPPVAPSLPPAAVPPVAPPLASPAPLVEPAALTLPTGGTPLGSAPTGGHWSRGIDVDDDPFENTYSRQVGSATTTSTSALVLPEMPTGSIAGPVAGTGEIIITGMIDLPRTVSSTGTVPTVHESPDIDDLFDAAELAPAPPDAAPVSASRAVSSHTQGHSIIAPRSRRPSANTVTTVLVAATVVMALVAIGLFVVAAVNGLF